jgi:hypothetical protein
MLIILNDYRMGSGGTKEVYKGKGQPYEYLKKSCGKAGSSIIRIMDGTKDTGHYFTVENILGELNVNFVYKNAENLIEFKCEMSGVFLRSVTTAWDAYGGAFFYENDRNKTMIRANGIHKGNPINHIIMLTMNGHEIDCVINHEYNYKLNLDVTNLK